jgi:hypothetical protein
VVYITVLYKGHRLWSCKPSVLGLEYISDGHGMNWMYSGPGPGSR